MFIGQCDCYQCRKSRKIKQTREDARKRLGIKVYPRWSCFDENQREIKRNECQARTYAWRAVGINNVTSSNLADFWEICPNNIQKLTDDELVEVGFGPNPIKSFRQMPENAQQIWEERYFKYCKIMDINVKRFNF